MHRNEHVSSRSDFSIGLDRAAGDARYIRKNALQPAATDYIRLGAAPLAIGAINIDGSSFGGVAINATGSVTAGAASFTTGAFSGDVSLAASTQFAHAFGGGTGPSFLRVTSTGGDFYFGTEDSAGSFFSQTAYSTVLYSPNHPIVLVGPGSGKLTVDAGITVGGNLTVGASTFVVTAATGAVSATGAANFGSSAGASATLQATGARNNWLGAALMLSSTTAPAQQWGMYVGAANELYIADRTGGVNPITITPATQAVLLGGALAITGALTVGTSTPHTSAQAQGDTTAKGWLFPRMTTAQKNAIGTPATGLVVFDTTLAKLCVYTGAAWETITSA